LEEIEKKQNAQSIKLEKTSKAMFAEMRKTKEKTNETNNEAMEIKAQMTTRATQGWILETFGELLSITKHIKSQFPVKENNTLSHNDNMMIDKDTNKWNNAGITHNEYDSDSDKENNGLGGNQSNCKYSKSDWFGINSP
jgi:hypothetical protein